MTYFKENEIVYINRASEDVGAHLHEHDFIEIAYVAKGKGIHIIDTNIYKVKKGDLFVINYDTAHEFRSSSMKKDEMLTVYNCIFKPEFIDYSLTGIRDFEEISHHFLFNSLSLDENEKTSDIKIEINNKSEIENLYKKMFYEYNNKEQGYVEIIRAYVIELLVSIFRSFNKVPTKNIEKKETIEKVIRFMKENYEKDIKLTDIAMMSFFSRNYLCRLFKETTGMTILEYIQKVRIQEACKMLVRTDETITNISYKVGYKDIKFFTELFKRYTKKTPSSYRKSKI